MEVCVINEGPEKSWTLPLWGFLSIPYLHHSSIIIRYGAPKGKMKEKKAGVGIKKTGMVDCLPTTSLMFESAGFNNNM